MISMFVADLAGNGNFCVSHSSDGRKDKSSRGKSWKIAR